MGNTNTVVGILLVILAFVVGLALWVVVGLIAGWVAPDDREWTFFWLTVLLFGPLGILAAAVASPRDPNYFVSEPEPRSIAKGRTRYRCARCGAESDLHEPKDFSCWRCGEKKYMVA
jgi:DNA-directed RNA polymerase subunit RPC12/RpoP